MTEYQQLLQAIEQYYGSGSDQWAEIAKYGIASDQAEQILKNVPGVNIVKNANGTIRSYNLNASENIVSNAEQEVNSNVPAVIKSVEVPANTGVETVTSPTGEAVKQMTFKSGMAQAGNFVFGSVLPAIGAAATGITLGKLIDKGLYNINPDFWDEHGMSTLNPDVWGDIIGTDSSGGKVLNMILGTTPDNKTQAYIDQNALAYMALYMQNKGVFNTGSVDYSSKEITVDNIDIPAGLNRIDSTVREIEYNGDTSYVGGTIGYTDISNMYPVAAYESESLGAELRTTFIESSDNVKFIITASAKAELTGYTIRNKGTNAYISGVSTSSNPYEFDNKTAQYGYVDGHPPYTTINTILPYVHVNINSSDLAADLTKRIAWTLLYGNWDKIETPVIDGIGTQDGAKTPDLSGAKSVDDALNKLKEQYPDLWNNAINHDVVQPDGTTKTYTYVPVAMPEIDKNGNPVSSSSNQANPQVNPLTATESLLKTITDLLRTFPPINPPDTGDGDTPVAPPVTGSASSLYAIYNPTLAEINSFGAWLWSDNFIDQIKKLFNDPMQAIIGLHKIYAQPITGGTQSIKVGYLDSGVSSAIVTNQYTTIDCGKVRLSEQFHNVFDYAPFTEVNLYLPFIGIVRLDISDVMRSSIHIVYHVDVLSGACLADVKVVRDSSGGTLYQYAGNASVTLPISSGSYMGIVASVAGIAGGIAGTIASGGSALPLIASSASSMFNAHTRVEHSGGFSGNAGAMGGKIPYLIISRPQTAMAKEFNQYIGYPSNFTTKLGSCSGFVKVLECHLENINATKSELDEIDSILKEGVII